MSRKQEERCERWREKIRRQEQSGQTVRAFCGDQSLREHAFYYWRQRFRMEKSPIGFALVETKIAGAEGPQPVDLMLASGDRLRIPGDAATLRLVLSVLREQQA